MKEKVQDNDSINNILHFKLSFQLCFQIPVSFIDFADDTLIASNRVYLCSTLFFLLYKHTFYGTSAR